MCHGAIGDSGNIEQESQPTARTAGRCCSLSKPMASKSCKTLDDNQIHLTYDSVKMTEESTFQGNTFDLLGQLENILESDPFIDEVGFIHPSHLLELNEGTDGCRMGLMSKRGCTVFWNRDHKLAISTEMLQPLFIAARHAYTVSSKRYKLMVNPLADGICSSTIQFESSIENELMRHSKALLLFSYDLGSAWNSRKIVLSRNKCFSLLMEELQFSALILSYAPKSEQAWSHRRWVIKTINGTYENLLDIVEKESKLVEKIAEMSKMNYRAWNHRGWLISFMSKGQILDELNQSRKWAEFHVADNCCFHYRRRLMLRMLKENYLKEDEEARCLSDSDVAVLWKEELNWNEVLIKRYIGREALWVHRRFLSQCWVEHFHTHHSLDTFLDYELQLLQSCLNVSSDEFEDGQVHTKLAAYYALWISKQIPRTQEAEFQAKLVKLELKTVLTNLPSEKQLLWEGLMS